MVQTTNKLPRSVPQTIFAMIAIIMGAMAFVQGGIGGRSVGWETMAIYTGPSVVAAVIAIAVRRSRLSYIAVGFAALAVVGFLLGA